MSDRDLLIHLRDTKQTGVMKQGRQVDGSERGEKYVLNIKKTASGRAHLASIDLSAKQDTLV